MPFAQDLPKDMRTRSKRRGPRMNSRVPVTIEWKGSGGPLRFESGFTRVVNNYGCLLVSPREIDVRERVRVTNLATRQIGQWRGGVEGNGTTRRLGSGSGASRSRSEFLGGGTLKITTLNVPARKPSAAHTKANVTTATSIASAARPLAAAAPVKAAVSSQERRRGQRVLLRIRANIHVALQGKATTLDAATLSVTPQGAVVVMKQNLAGRNAAGAGTRGHEAASGLQSGASVTRDSRRFSHPARIRCPGARILENQFPAVRLASRRRVVDCRVRARRTLRFLTGPAAGDILGKPLPEVLQQSDSTSASGGQHVRQRTPWLAPEGLRGPAPFSYRVKRAKRPGGRDRRQLRAAGGQDYDARSPRWKAKRSIYPNAESILLRARHCKWASLWKCFSRSREN